MADKASRLSVQAPDEKVSARLRQSELSLRIDRFRRAYVNQLPPEARSQFVAELAGIKHEANLKDFDPVMKILDRASMELEVVGSIARAHGSGLGIIMLDVDDFGQINKRWGWSMGDNALRALGHILNDQLREETDIAGRFGDASDEVVVLSRNVVQPTEFFKIVRRIKTALEDPFVQHQHGYDPTLRQLTVSMGAVWLEWPANIDRRNCALRVRKELFSLVLEGLVNRAKEGKPSTAVHVAQVSLFDVDQPLSVRMEGTLP